MKKKQHPFSIVIITLNEELNLERCLKSVRNLTDDIVVVDSGSTDKTVEIAQLFGARVFTRTFDDYSSQKNYANSLAKYPWIVSVDADEEIDSQLYKALNDFLPQLEGEVFVFDRKTNYCGKWIKFSGLRHDYIERVFNKEQYKWQGNIHERLHPRPKKTTTFDGRLNHFTYATIDEHIEVSIKYPKLQSEEYINRGKKIRWHHLFISPALRFVKHYFFKLGFLDGYEGFLIARIASFVTFYKYSRTMWINQQSKNK